MQNAAPTKKMQNAENTRNALYETMFRVFTEVLGSELEPVDDPDDDVNLPEFTCGLSRCFLGVSPVSEHAACLSISVRLGRVFTGYTRTLRWLAQNRAGNTLPLMSDEQSWDHRDLWLSCSRVTLPDDEIGIRETLADVRIEIARVEIGLHSWFPQLLSGASISNMEGAPGDTRDVLEEIVGNPWAYADWVRQNPEAALENFGTLPATVFQWIGEWEESLDWSNRAWAALAESEKTAEAAAERLHAKCVALRELRRNRELLRVASEFGEVIDDPANPIIATIRCCALAALGRNDELLRIVRSSHYDENPRIWFWRSLAHMGLGRMEESLRCYQNYENAVGLDRIARQRLRALAPETESGE